SSDRLLPRNAPMTTESHANENLTNIGVSAKLGEIRTALIECGNRLEKVVHARVGGLAIDLLNEIEGQTCRIAFIGQVNAGKSSLINARIQKPDFLPTDVNPSTAVAIIVCAARSS